MAKSRFDWHPTQAEVDAIVAELRPVITRICERQAGELAELRAAAGRPPANS